MSQKNHHTFAKRRATAPIFWVAILLGSTSLIVEAAGQEATADVSEAQSSPTESSSAALAMYADAANFQNNSAFELAVDEWTQFLQRFPQDPLAPKAQYYLGVCQLQLKKFAPAATSFQAVITQYPEFDELESAHLNLGWCQYSLARAGDQQKFAEAAKTFGKLVDTYPGSKELDQALFFCGESLYAIGKKKDAALAYDKLVAAFPKSALRGECLYALGVTLEELDEHAQAGQAYDLFLKEFPSNDLATEVTMRKAETILQTGKAAEAEKLFAQVAATEGFTSADHAMLRQAYCAARQDKNAEAAAIYAALPQRFADSAYVSDAQLSAGRCFYRANQPDNAAIWFAKSVTSGGKQAVEAAHWLSRIHLQQNEPAKAIELLSNAIPNAGDSPFAVNLKLDHADAMYATQDRHADALQEYVAIFEAYPKHEIAAETLYNAAFTALGLKQYDQAFDLAKKFTTTFPTNPLLPDAASVTAECELQRKRYPQAETAYRSLLEKYPQNSAVGAWRNRLGLVMHFLKNDQGTIDLLNPLVAELKPPAVKAEAAYLIGISHFRLSQFKEAEESLRSSILADPKWREADVTLLYLARAQYKLGKLDQAQTTLASLGKAFPTSSQLAHATYRLGECLYAAGKFDEAAATYDRLLQKWPQSNYASYALYGKGWAKLKSQHYDQANVSFSALLEQDSETKLRADALFARGMCRRQLGKSAEAIVDINLYLDSNPNASQRADALYERGLAEVGAKQHQQAAETFALLLKEQPGYASADKVLYEMAWSFTSMEDADSAVRTFTSLAKQHPQSGLAAEANFHIGEGFYLNKEYAKAAASYAQATGKAQDAAIQEKATYKLGWSQYQLNDFEQASASFSRQLEQFPGGVLVADARFMKAETLFKLKKYQEAYTEFIEVRKGTASSPQIAALTLLHAAQAAAQLGKWDESLPMFSTLIKDHSESSYLAEAYFERGQAHRKLNQLDKAVVDFRQAAERSRGEVGARSLFMVGELAFQGKQYDQAIKEYQRVMFRFGTSQPGEKILAWQARAAYEAGRCAEVQIQEAKTKPSKVKRIAEAKRFFRYIIEKHPKSELASEAKKRLEALTKL